MASRLGVNMLPSLYDSSLKTVANHYKVIRNVVDILPEKVLFDILYQLYLDKQISTLGGEYSKIENMERLLRNTDKRLKLLRSFQAVMESGNGVALNLAQVYQKQCSTYLSEQAAVERTIDLGLRLGGFLSEGGWFMESEKTLLACQNICHLSGSSPQSLRKLLECCHKLLHTQATFCHFAEAQLTSKLAMTVVNQLRAVNEVDTNLAGLYKEISVLHFSRSEYEEAYVWAVQALKLVTPHLPICVTIEVFRQVAKSCVVKREFKRAGLVARQAMCLSNEFFNTRDPKYSDSLLDYGFYLINFDSVRQSVVVYELALNIRIAMYGSMNLHVAIAHEDLAYALYVHEYSSGRFLKAREHADRAISIMEKILPVDHLMLASVRRVKALILEEIALDSMIHQAGMNKLLKKAEDLHMSALDLAMITFGERNVQTAKHFGNLGRLYQSMRKFQEAETMHLKAIDIKEDLLGPDDYEVGLSIGHLASLYNYHMKKYKKAEQLYHRSVAISLKLFGKSYSGLEYDYRGLIHVYHKLGDVGKVAEYTLNLNNWKVSREVHVQTEDDPVDREERALPILDITAQFFMLDRN